MVGQLYAPGDKRTDAAYTIFYMGINVGGMIGPFICGLVGNTGNPDDFKWAFLAGAIGMLISVITLHNQSSFCFCSSLLFANEQWQKMCQDRIAASCFEKTTS